MMVMTMMLVVFIPKGKRRGGWWMGDGDAWQQGLAMIGARETAPQRSQREAREGNGSITTKIKDNDRTHAHTFLIAFAWLREAIGFVDSLVCLFSHPVPPFFAISPSLTLAMCSFTPVA